MAAGPACFVEVQVTPRSSQPRLMIDGDLLRIRVSEAPVDGQATEAARRALAAALDIPTVAVSLTTGRRSRTKLFRVEGLTRSQVRVRLGG
ncbi:MAG: DUF167 family protein [Actinomycetota bacterium]|nr:DUF167 family protein [Actinomycetota bacterium]